MDCFVACAPRNDEGPKPPAAGLPSSALPARLDARRRGSAILRHALFVSCNDQFGLLKLRLEAVDLGLSFRKDISTRRVARLQFIDERAVLRNLAPVPIDFLIV